MIQRLEEVCREIFAQGLFDGKYRVGEQIMTPNTLSPHLPLKGLCHAAIATLQQRIPEVQIYALGFHVEEEYNGKSFEGNHVVGLLVHTLGVLVLDPTIFQYRGLGEKLVYELQDYPLIGSLLPRLEDYAQKKF